MSVERLGPESLSIRQVPVILKNANAEQLLRDVLSDLLEHGSSDRIGAYPAANPVTPGDVAATVLWRFGIERDDNGELVMTPLAATGAGHG